MILWGAICKGSIRPRLLSSVDPDPRRIFPSFSGCPPIRMGYSPIDSRNSSLTFETTSERVATLSPRALLNQEAKWGILFLTPVKSLKFTVDGHVAWGTFNWTCFIISDE
jgi:hypothetical protein